MSENITLYTFLLVFKIVESLLCILNKDIFAKFISNNFSHCIDQGEFPYELKHVGVILVHKKKGKCFKENYHPVSIPASICKV